MGGGGGEYPGQEYCVEAICQCEGSAVRKRGLIKLSGGKNGWSSF